MQIEYIFSERGHTFDKTVYVTSAAYLEPSKSFMTEPFCEKS